MSRVVTAALADIVAIVVFVMLGRSNHNEGTAIGGIIAVAAPFLIGAAVGWLVGRVWRHPAALVNGLVVWFATIGIGMPLRRWAFDRGTAPSFVVVATLVTGAFLVGWRTVWQVTTRRDQIP